MTRRNRKPLRPEGSPRLGETFTGWRDFTNRVARPLVECEDDEQIGRWHTTLMAGADVYYLAVALVMADNRIRAYEKGLQQIVEGDYPADALNAETWAGEVLHDFNAVNWENDAGGQRD
jgi:hypothetical protein